MSLVLMPLFEVLEASSMGEVQEAHRAAGAHMPPRWRPFHSAGT